MNNKTKAITGGIVCAALLGGGAASYQLHFKNVLNYSKAEKLLEEKSYDEAAQLFAKCSGYKDAKDRLAKFIYIPTNSTSTDENGDKTEYKWEYETDGSNITKITESNAKSGEKESEVLYTYENGRLAKKETDSGITAKYTYDDAGRMTEVNGVYSVRKFEYNENGDISHELLTMNIPGDFDGTILQYETDGMFTQLAELDNRATTADVTDTVDKVYNYSSDGELESIKLTNAQNGTQNCTGEYKYEDGRLTSYEYSFVNSAYKSYNANFTYDGNGRLTEADNETAYTSSVNDISYHTTVEYSANGTKSISVDEGRTTRDGSHEDYSTTKYEFDKNGLLTNTVTQYKADGEEDKEEYAHDVFGNLISISDKSGEDTISYKAVGYSESKPGVINEMIYDADDYDEYFKASYMPNLPAGNLNILDL